MKFYLVLLGWWLMWCVFCVFICIFLKNSLHPDFFSTPFSFLKDVTPLSFFLERFLSGLTVSPVFWCFLFICRLLLIGTLNLDTFDSKSKTAAWVEPFSGLLPVFVLIQIRAVHKLQLIKPNYPKRWKINKDLSPVCSEEKQHIERKLSLDASVCVKKTKTLELDVNIPQGRNWFVVPLHHSIWTWAAAFTVWSAEPQRCVLWRDVTSFPESREQCFSRLRLTEHMSNSHSTHTEPDLWSDVQAEVLISPDLSVNGS